MKLEFTEQDFLNHDMSPAGPSVSRYGLEKFQAERIAEIANARLAAMLEGAPRVFARKPPNGFEWNEQPSMDSTHTALLINIEEIKK